ncbi:DUF4199 domain-containing protein [Xanthomarina sp. F2636L]|uniref:DUF4199 domain-containing protein n=1 Tax=Xanthomarina sp. F2636L TaxID=2996018 RepID=UPI00225E001D|nr:DUF4199 domain-containing protein [Xanthomarina sp. F2636L]MCX7551052.1 DUF4199 domain-containing protein [Xanthomarina sp. F2636L]
MNTSAKISIKYGFITAILLIAYFLILKLMGMHNNPWLRLFNGLIMALGIYTVIKQYKLISGNEFTYINGFKTGLITGFLATFVFALFMGIYMFHLDVEFMNNLLKDWFQNDGYGGGILIFIILIEGLSSTTVLTLTFMQIFKNSKNVPQNE